MDTNPVLLEYNDKLGIIKSYCEILWSLKINSRNKNYQSGNKNLDN